MGSVKMVLLDTCALLWWTLEPAKLSDKAQRVCDRIFDEGAFVSSISIWEIGIKIKKGNLDIGDTLEGFVQKLYAMGTLEIIPIDEIIWMRNLGLDWKHRDPVDRTIVATAQLKKLPIMTKDRIIRTYYKRTIW